MGQVAGLLAVSAGLTAALLAVAVIDRRSLRIPDWLSLPLIAAGLAVALLWGDWPAHLIGALAGYAALAAIGEWYFRRRGMEGLGLGDAKLFAAAGAWLGWQALPMVLLIAALGGLGQALLRGRARRGEPLAFGPWLALGFWLMWIGALAGGDIILNFR